MIKKELVISRKKKSVEGVFKNLFLILQYFPLLRSVSEEKKRILWNLFTTAYNTNTVQKRGKRPEQYPRPPLYKKKSFPFSPSSSCNYNCIHVSIF